jgi:hypothetical protein
LLFAGSAYLDAHEEPQTPKDLQKHASLFMMRTGIAPVWRLRHASKAKADVVIRLTPRLLSDDMIGLKQAAIAGLGIVALPGYVCREDVRSGALRRVLPAWLAGDSTITALIPYRQGLLPSVRVFRAPEPVQLARQSDDPSDPDRIEKLGRCCTSVLWMPPGANRFCSRQAWGRRVAYASQFADPDNRAPEADAIKEEAPAGGRSFSHGFTP